MQSTITGRITYLIGALKENTNSFSNKIGVSQSTVATAIKRNKGVKSDLIEKITIAYPIVNIDWLITGRGEMLKSTSENNSRNVHNTSKISGGVMTGDNNAPAPINASISSDNEQQILLLEARVLHLEEMLKEKERFIQVLLKNNIL